MTIEQRSVGKVTVFAISGDITMSGNAATRVSDKVRSALQEGRKRILLDLGSVRYVDSVGLGELVQAFSAVRTRGGALKLLNVTRRLADLLVVTKLLTVFDCYDDEAAAISSFRQPATPAA
jgi:anti-sigma B factor antagonist